MKHFFPMLLALVAAGVMGYVLYAFLKRLNQIEHDFWDRFTQPPTTTTPDDDDEEPSA